MNIRQVFSGHSFVISPELKHNYDPSSIIEWLGGQIVQKAKKGKDAIFVSVYGEEGTFKMFDLLNNYVFKNKLFRIQD